MVNDLAPIRSGWNESLMILKGPLTDRKIGQYQKQGWYSQEMKEKRRERQEKKRARWQKREGNFVVDKTGSKIYSPA